MKVVSTVIATMVTVHIVTVHIAQVDRFGYETITSFYTLFIHLTVSELLNPIILFVCHTVLPLLMSAYLQIASPYVGPQTPVIIN